MNLHLPATRNRVSYAAFPALFLVLAITTSAFAQQRVARNYPAGKNVRIELKNLRGTITVETWARDEIRITATMEAPAVHFNPRQTDSGLVIDIVGDNRDRRDVGDVTTLANPDVVEQIRIMVQGKDITTTREELPEDIAKFGQVE